MSSEQVKNRIRAAFEKARHLGPSSLVPARPIEEKPEVKPVMPVEPVEEKPWQDTMREAFDQARVIHVPKAKKRKYDTAQFSSLRARGLSEGEIRSLAYGEAEAHEFDMHANALIEKALDLPEVKRQHQVRTLHEKSFDVGSIHSVSKAEFDAAIKACLESLKKEKP